MPATPTFKEQARDAGSASHRPASAACAGEGGHRAAARAEESSAGRLDLPLIGTIVLPPRKQLAFLAGLGALAVAGVIEWPVAAAVGLGHLLATSHSNETVRAFGEALEEV